MKKICETCNDEFEPKFQNQRFCSKKCAGKHNNPGHKGGKGRGLMVRPMSNVLVCNMCGKLLTNSQRRANTIYCSNKCWGQSRRDKTKRKIIEDIERKGTVDTGNIGKYYEIMERKAAKIYLLEKHGNRCAICGVERCVNFFSGEEIDIPLIVDHIDGDCLNNNINNFRLLCPICNHLSPTFCGKNKKREKLSIRFYNRDKR